MEHFLILCLYLSLFSELQRSKFHKDSREDIQDAINLLVSDRPLNIYCFQEICSLHEPTGMCSLSITCLYCTHCDWSLFVSSKKCKIIVHQNLVGIKNQMLTVSSLDLWEQALQSLIDKHIVMKVWLHETIDNCSLDEATCRYFDKLSVAFNLFCMCECTTLVPLIS